MQTSSRSRWSVAAFALVAACNQALGLEPGVTDTDGDRIADAVDNCPRDPNPQQADRDHNGLGDVCDCATSGVDDDGDQIDDACDDCVGEPRGEDLGGDGIDDGCESCALATGEDADGDGLQDACDPCVFGDAHDEDADGMPDACDDCPSVPGAQLDSDGDMLGDVCDTNDLLVTQTRFDGMAAQDLSLWLGETAPWRWDADGMVTDATNDGRFSSITLASPVFLVETTAPATVRSGIVLVGPGISLLYESCTIDASRRARLYEETVVASQALGEPAPGQGVVRLRFTSRPDAATGSLMQCDALDATGAVLSRATWNSSIAPGVPIRVGLLSEGASRFNYLWVAWQ